jgi:hypothetical protein
MLGPGVVWLALAQGSGELIGWPRLVAKYGTAFLFLLIPACLLTGVTVGTMHLASPAALILLSAVLGFIGTVVFTGALLFLNYLWLPRFLPESVRPRPIGAVGLSLSWLAYLTLASVYLALLGRSRST